MMSTHAAAAWLSARVLAVTALATYVAVSMILFGLPIIGDFNHASIGRGDAIGRADAALTSWFLAWWPYALTHKLNPLVSHLVWAPMGVDLAWTTTIPGASIPTLPLTLLFGPLVTYNDGGILSRAGACDRALWPDRTRDLLSGSAAVAKTDNGPGVAVDAVCSG
jgi:hypothetical protein